MKTNADLTLYTKSTATGAEVWTRSAVYGVMWEDRRAATARQTANVKADEIAVYIPMTHTTAVIRAGDVIVRGIVADVIGPSFSMSALRAKYPLTSGLVKSVDRMEAGSRSMWHWQIGAG